MTFKVVVPARYASTRLPGKPLAEIHDKPMIQWVVETAARSRADEVIVATDDARIAAAVTAPAGKRVSVVMTAADHPSGTDRLAEVARQRAWPADTVVVNVQGDEPRMPPALIDQVAALLIASSGAAVATLCTPILGLEEFLNPNVVKVVRDDQGLALYFSRAPIPWHRSGAGGGLESQRKFTGAYRHLGIYAYRAAALQRLTALPAGSLEQAESLEQLRALQAGLRIAVAEACSAPGIGVDTLQDLERLRAMEKFDS